MGQVSNILILFRYGRRLRRLAIATLFFSMGQQVRAPLPPALAPPRVRWHAPTRLLAENAEGSNRQLRCPTAADGAADGPPLRAAQMNSIQDAYRLRAMAWSPQVRWWRHRMKWDGGVVP